MMPYMMVLWLCAGQAGSGGPGQLCGDSEDQVSDHHEPLLLLGQGHHQGPDGDGGF